MKRLFTDPAFVWEQEVEKTADRPFDAALHAVRQYQTASETGEQATREDPPPPNTFSLQHRCLQAYFSESLSGRCRPLYLGMLRRIPALLLPAVFLISCSHPAAETAKEPPKQYQLHGEVVRVDPQAKTATINAQKIEGWMEAMSMEYPVKDPQGLSTLHPNDCVDATVFVQGTDFWVGDLKHADAAPGTCVANKTPQENSK